MVALQISGHRSCAHSSPTSSFHRWRAENVSDLESPQRESRDRGQRSSRLGLPGWYFRPSQCYMTSGTTNQPCEFQVLEIQMQWHIRVDTSPKTVSSRSSQAIFPLKMWVCGHSIAEKSPSTAMILKEAPAVGGRGVGGLLLMLPGTLKITFPKLTTVRNYFYSTCLEVDPRALCSVNI